MGRKKKQIGKLEVFSFTLNPKTIRAADKVIEFKKFESRSALVELALKKFILEVIKDGKI